MSEKAEAIDYKKPRYWAPNLVLVPVSPITSSSVQLTTAPSQCVFRVGGDSSVINLYNSYLRFISTPLTDTPAITFFYFNCAYIDSVSVRIEGMQVCNLKNVIEYTNTVSIMALDLETFNSYDIASGTTSAIGLFQFCRPNNNSSVSDTTEANFPVRPDNTPANRIVDEMCYVLPGTAAGAEPVLRVSYKLGDILPFSVFGLDRNYPTGRSIWEISFMLAAFDRISFTATAKTNPSGGAAAADKYTTFSDIKLYLAVERQPDIINDIMTRYENGGISMRVDDIEISGQETLSGTSQNFNVILAAQSPNSYLKGVFWAMYNSTTNSNTSLDHSQLAGTKRISSFRSFLNSRRIGSESDYDLTTLDDWVKMRPLIKNSPLGLSSNIYQYSWVWAELFDFDLDVVSMKKQSDQIFGLPLDRSQMITYQCTTASANNRVLYWVVVNKELKLSSTGNSFGQ